MQMEAVRSLLSRFETESNASSIACGELESKNDIVMDIYENILAANLL